MAYTKRNVAHKESTTVEKSEEVKAETAKDTKASVKKVEKPKSAREYKPDEAILCHSMFAGTLLFTGIKTKMIYEFSNIGDTRWVEYQDLFAALLARKEALFAPDIIIDDEELLEGRYWSELKDIYEGMYTKEDLVALINLSISDFSVHFKRLPIGFKRTIATMVAEMIRNGTFDSMGKIKIIDEECGTDLKLLLE